jgi:hypothetical protein
MGIDTNDVFDRKEVYVGRDCGGAAYDITPEFVAKYIAGTGDDNPWYRGKSPFGKPLAPALILYDAVYRTLEWYLPNLYGNLHARQEWELFAPTTVGERLTTRSVIIDRYIKRDREYLVNEVLVGNASGQIVSRSRTHQSFLLPEQTGTQGFIVDRAREKDSKRASKIGKLGERGGQPIDAPMRKINEAMCMAFSGPARNYHNDKQKAVELGFSGNCRAGDVVGVHGRRNDDAAIRPRIPLRRKDGSTAGQRCLGQRRDRTERSNRRTASGRKTHARGCRSLVREERRDQTIVGTASAIEL